MPACCKTVQGRLLDAGGGTRGVEIGIEVDETRRDKGSRFEN